MGDGSTRGPAEGIWSGGDDAPFTRALLSLARGLLAADGAGAHQGRGRARARGRVRGLQEAATDPTALARSADLLVAAGGATADASDGPDGDPVTLALRIGAAAVLGGDPGDAATIAFAALGGTASDEDRLIAAVDAAEVLAGRIRALLVAGGTVAHARAELPAAVLGAGLAVGLLVSDDEDVLERAFGLMVSCVVGQGPPAATRDARAFAVGRAAGDLRLVLALAGASFTANPRALEAPRGLIDALTGSAPAPELIGLLEVPVGSDEEGVSAPTAPDEVPALDPESDPVLLSLASFVAEVEVGPEARHAARRTLANAVGLMVGAADADAVRIAASVVPPSGSDRRAVVPGRSGPVAAATAAFLGGIATHYEDFDDTHLRTVAHPGAAVPPAVLALAQAVGADWEVALDAVAVGVEAMLRVADGMSPDHLDRGWHVTPMTGHLGAAAGCARVLGLDARATAHAMGLALVIATGTQSVLGTMAKPFHPGRAARDGVEAALLAARDWEAPSGVLEGPDGFARSHSTDPDLGLMVGDLGARWELAANAFKPYACGIVAHPSIDAGIALRGLVPDPERLASVELEVNPFTLTAMGLEEPGPGLEGKFSVYHATAVGYLTGRAGPDEFTDARVLDPAVIAVRRRLRFIPSERIARDAVEVVARTVDGEEHRLSIAHATGSVDRPMTDIELHAKVVGEASRSLDEVAARSLADRLLDAGVVSLREVVALAIP